MEGFNQERRGLFDGLRVPHSLGGLVISFVGLCLFLLLVVAIEEVAHVPPADGPAGRLLSGMLGNATSVLGYPGAVVARLGGWSNHWTSYSAITWVLFLLSFAGVWAFVSTAVQRIVAHAIAREEGIPLSEALRFGWKKFVPTLLSVVLVGFLAGVFWVVVNATLAGQLADVTGGFGNVVLGVLFPVVLVSTFLAVFLVLLGLFGFNLASAVIATEDADTFEGLSRAWNYLLARPWQVLISYLAQFLYLAVVMWAGTWFLHASIKSMSIGEWGLGTAPRRVELEEEDLALLKESLPPGARLQVAYLPGKGQWLYEYVFQRVPADQKGRLDVNQGVELALEQYKADTGDYPTETEGLRALVESPLGWLPEADRQREGLKGWKGPYLLTNEVPRLRGELVHYVRDPQHVSPPDPWDLRLAGPDGQIKTADDVKGLQGVGQGLGRPLNVAPIQGATLEFTGWCVWFWLLLAQLALVAYSVYYLLAAQCTTYFFLRHDLEGDDYAEITLEDEEEAETSYDYGQVWKPEGAAPAPGGAPPGSGAGPQPRGGEGKPLPTIEPPKS